MLNRELCKKLKDSGFSQPHVLLRNYYTDEGHMVGGWQIEKVEDGFVLIPNLSDLIDACGNGFWNLQKLSHSISGVTVWRCNFFEGDEKKMGKDGEWQFEGRTSEEAVVNLWLAINEKKI